MGFETEWVIRVVEKLLPEEDQKEGKIYPPNWFLKWSNLKALIKVYIFLRF